MSPYRSCTPFGARTAVPSTAGSQLAAAVLPNIVELEHESSLVAAFGRSGRPSIEQVMRKSSWRAFYHTGLEWHVGELASNTIVFAGCTFPV